MQFVCTFPGQGSQSVGMLADLAEHSAVVKETLEEASDALGQDLWKLVAQGPEELLGQTQNTQPAMLAASNAIWRIFSNHASSPIAMAGHSFGEYSALVSANALEFREGVRLAQFRGQTMQAAVAEDVGSMAAILGMDDTALIELCERISSSEAIVEAVNFNAPGQVVVAGHVGAVEQLIEAAKQAGAKRALQLPVSVPAHSSLMRDAAEKFATELENVSFTQPQVPVIHNADLQTHEVADEIRLALAQQLYSPVRWVETVQQMATTQETAFIEVGPGKVLTGLNKRIDKGLKSICVSDAQSIEKALALIEE